jgi:predicted nuclease of predicted toxin-antitoxin system
LRILADENVPGIVVSALRDDGHDVSWIMEEARQSPDHFVLDRAQSQDRLIVTFDKDFGELAFRDRLPSSRGVVLVRTALSSPEHIARLVSTAIAGRDDWEGHFSVIGDGEVRMTPLS